MPQLMCVDPSLEKKLANGFGDDWAHLPCTGFEALRWDWLLPNGRYTHAYPGRYCKRCEEMREQEAVNVATNH